GARTCSVKTQGTYKSLEQVRDTVVASSGGRIVRVRDLAQVSWESQPYTYLGRFNGERAVFVTANQKDGYNVLQVNARIEAALQHFTKDLPKRIRLQRGFDQSQNVASRLEHLYRDLAIAIALVLLTLLPLGLRAASIVMVSIPLSFAFGLTALDFLGYSLNQISIAAFVVALGLLVDDSIVVTENIARHLRGGAPRTQAALAGTRQIFVAIVGCTATLIFAFLPLMALPGVSGKFIRVLPVTVVATIVGSLLIALFMIPFIASRVLREHGAAEGNALLQRVMAAIHRYYRPALHYCLARPRATLLAAIGGSLLLSAALVPLVGKSLFPKADTPQFLVTVETPDGTSLAATDAALHYVEGELAHLPDVRSWFANLGHGNPLIYYNIVSHSDALNYAEVFVQLKRYDTRSTPRQLDALRARLARYPGAHIYVKEFVNGPRILAPISVRVIGPDLEVIERLAGQVERLIQTTPGTRDVDNPLRVARTNLRLAVDTQKAALLGVPTVDFERAVRLSVAGVPVSTYKDSSGEQYAIVVRTPIAARADLGALEQIRVPAASGAILPVAQLASLEFQKAPTQIERYNRERAATVNAEVERGFNTARVTAQVVKRLEGMSWPRGYRFTLGGEAESSQEAFGGIGTAIIIAVFGIFAILVLEFGNFKSTLIVLTVVPL
ncbi:MAG TPA: efflux RND transporter permease subunit, partial [Candidatus Dormibacteraeota bacterium]|nr:efflux RND transporter permease subunit [Candidatus Dormibacteraeota bacterium]